MEEMMNFIQNTGFAVGVAAFLLIRVDKTLKELRDSIISLTVTIDKMKVAE